MSALLGLAVPMGSMIVSCSKEEDDIAPSSGMCSPSTSSQKVLIIGAGPAGMTAGYLLAQQGIDFQIIEAAPTYGGRTKTNTNFIAFTSTIQYL